MLVARQSIRGGRKGDADRRATSPGAGTKQPVGRFLAGFLEYSLDRAADTLSFDNQINSFSNYTLSNGTLSINRIVLRNAVDFDHNIKANITAASGTLTADLAEAGQAIAANRLRPVIGSTYGIGEVRQAYEQLARGSAQPGKIVLAL